MVDSTCPQCGAAVAADSTECKFCGSQIARQAAPQQPVYQQPIYQQQPQTVIYQQVVANNDGINPAWPIKSKIAAGVLAIVLGGLGIHKFYLGKVGLGVVYLLLCWTGIPAIIGLIEGIIYLTSNDHNFQVKNNVRIS
ncbi:MAG: TM2 domain-containing protein [Oscillospiraceae bacterium]